MKTTEVTAEEDGWVPGGETAAGQPYWRNVVTGDETTEQPAVVQSWVYVGELPTGQKYWRNTVSGEKTTNEPTIGLQAPDAVAAVAVVGNEEGN